MTHHRGDEHLRAAFTRLRSEVSRATPPFERTLTIVREKLQKNFWRRRHFLLATTGPLAASVALFWLLWGSGAQERPATVAPPTAQVTVFSVYEMPTDALLRCAHLDMSARHSYYSPTDVLLQRRRINL